MELKIVLNTIIFLVLIATGVIGQNPDDIIGKYRLPNDLDIEIYKSNDKYFGKIIALNGDRSMTEKDVKNPDKEERNSPLLGKVIIEDLEFSFKKKKWINGKMYGPKKGMYFNLKINEIREKEIEVVGSKFLFWKTISWIKLLN